MRVLNKWIGIILLLLMYFAISAFLFMLPLNATKKRNYAIQTTSLFARYILSVLGVRVHLKNREHLHKKNGCLIISNHVSYVDVLVLSSLNPSVFITSSIIAIPLYIGLGKVFFDDMDDFLDSLRLLFQPQWLTLLRGESNEVSWDALKFLFYLILRAAFATTVYKVAKHIF